MASLSVRLPQTSLERLDRIAAERGLSRSEAVRALIEGDAPAEPADLREALALLSMKARGGSVAASLGLVRALLETGRQTTPAKRRRDELAARRKARAV